jgi:hypothetical protein
MAVTVVHLPNSLAAWKGVEFAEVFKREVAALGVSRLSLQAGVAIGSHALSTPPTVMLLGTSEEDGKAVIRAGIFFRSVIAGCSCADDPTPVNELNEYCVLRFDLDLTDGMAEVYVVTD